MINELSPLPVKGSVWNVVSSNVSRSSICRFNWKDVFGVSLTNVICSYYAKGYSVDDTFLLLRAELMKLGFDDDELVRKLKINVFSRYAEIQIESKIIRSG